MQHTDFTTTTRGLRRDTPPMLLFERAKKYGIWNPSDLDLTKDKEDFARLTAEEKDIVLRLTAMFVAGEETVTLDLLPLIQVIAHEGRLEEEMYLATFLWEEAKHVDFFSRLLREVADAPIDLTVYQAPSYKYVVYEFLPHALHALQNDPSPAALAKASCAYNMIVEGMLAETGYHGYFTIIDRFSIMPGARDGISKLKLDESRHIAYGVYLLSRLMAENPDLWDVIETTMNHLFPYALGVTTEIFAHYETPPFGITQEEFLEYGTNQFQKRFQRIQRARDMSIDQLNTETEAILEANDA